MGRLIDKGSFLENISLFFILKGRERWENERRGQAEVRALRWKLIKVDLICACT